ncbi:CpaF family protein [Sandaracinus amylolyticus]|uniref:Type II/IV secretion system ATP hydrolase TadA/VirB11/CpaF, TadA subfamily n=1 Tax=Sandaracinus amylolyticus TaxID=927083 RepID=A0A0F6WAM7_9BACT|nr:CpaF family protein [Sandaracinus amylolyticus]AKF11667.1 Type II/IV secretion system ATP hydrolase TadA/VirB11/CpaF, TadA subfamily [Sandaracinus amylolyticus]
MSGNNTIPKDVFEQTILNFFAPIRPFLDDPSVSEVMINGPDQIYIERKGKLTLTGAKFSSRDALTAALRNLAQFVGRHVDEHRPILEARLPDGSRVEAVLPPAAPDGPHVAIRRFFRETLTVERLVGFGSFTPEAAEFLKAVVTVKENTIVAGGTGSGKTSLLNALTGFIPNDDRIVVIEDSQEVQPQQPHIVQLEARPPDARGRGQVSIRDLFKATLRMRPDRIVVGEIRSGEALDLVQAMTSGHGGCMATVHATYPLDTLNRLETMCLMSDIALPLHALRAQIASGVDIIVQTSRLRDGSRCVTHISEVQGYDPEKGYDVKDVFVRRYHGDDAQGKVVSTFELTGFMPKCVEHIHGYGLRLPNVMYEMAQRTGGQAAYAGHDGGGHGGGGHGH